jgi:hypothetical protein
MMNIILILPEKDYLCESYNMAKMTTYGKLLKAKSLLKNFSLGAICLIFSLSKADAQIKVIDEINRQPLVSVTITGTSGAFIGLTDAKGFLPSGAYKEAKISLRHVAYKTRNLKMKEVKDSAITLTPNIQQITEVMVKGPKITYLQLRGYFRLYQAKDSALEYYKDGYMDSFIRKGLGSREHKLKTRVLVDKNALTKEGNKSKDSWIQDLMDPTCLDNDIANTIISNADSINADSNEYFLHNLKGRIKGYAKKNKEAGILTAEKDELAFKENGELNLWAMRLFGFRKFHVTAFTSSEAYHCLKDTVTLKDMVGFFTHMRIITRLKGDTEDRTLDIYGEYYVTEKRFLTTEQMKERWNTPFEMKGMTIPETVPKLPEALENNLKKMVPYKSEDTEEEAEN